MKDSNIISKKEHKYKLVKEDKNLYIVNTQNMGGKENAEKIITTPFMNDTVKVTLLADGITTAFLSVVAGPSVWMISRLIPLALPSATFAALSPFAAGIAGIGLVVGAALLKGGFKEGRKEEGWSFMRDKIKYEFFGKIEFEEFIKEHIERGETLPDINGVDVDELLKVSGSHFDISES